MLRKQRSHVACSHCGVILRIEEFRKHGNGINSWCTPCLNKNDSIRKKGTEARVKINKLSFSSKYKRAKFVYTQKLNRHCDKCGIIYYPWQMEYDHINPTSKELPISRMINLKVDMDRLTQEISKCQLLCTGCHRLKTYHNNDHIFNCEDRTIFATSKHKKNPITDFSRHTEKCKSCEQDRNVEFFSKSMRFTGKCLACVRPEVTEARRAQIRLSSHLKGIEIREFINKLKSGPCIDCSKHYEPLLMDFDHVRGTKVANLSRAPADRWKKSRILAEIEKCELVCCWCHRTRTYRRLAKSGKVYQFDVPESSISFEESV